MDDSWEILASGPKYYPISPIGKSPFRVASRAAYGAHTLFISYYEQYRGRGKGGFLAPVSHLTHTFRRDSN